MDIYRRSRLSEQELEALELREREVNTWILCLDENPDIPAFNTLFCLDGVLLCSQVGPDPLGSRLPSGCHSRPVLPHQAFILLLCLAFNSKFLSKIEGYIKSTCCPAICTSVNWSGLQVEWPVSAEPHSGF